MKKTLAIVLLSAIGLAAQAPASTKTTAQKAPGIARKTVAPPKTSTPVALTIPKDAVANPDGTYTWKDKQGKSWTFAHTPFGVMKSATSSAPSDSNSLAGIKAIDAGDKVRFETPSPFGVIKREKNKTDLTDEERNLYNSQNPAPATKQD
jgi:hypothetical protein